MLYFIALGTAIVGLVVGIFAPPLVREMLTTQEPVATVVQQAASSEETGTSILQPIILSQPLNTPAASVQQTGNIELKIARCEAEKDQAHSTALQQINQAADQRLKEVFASLEKQYQDAVEDIFAAVGVDRISGDYSLSGFDKSLLLSESNYDATRQAEALYKNQQTFWLNQKAEIEASRKSATDKLDVRLSEEYNTCLGS
ncbi:MAG TPA: hypothetical protein VJA87_03690 [Candidatus Paceibacterota bacterium]